MEGDGVDIKDLTPEQIERAKACETPEDILALAESMGVELAPDQLDAIAGDGGGGWDPSECYTKDNPCNGYDPYSPPVV